MLNWDDCQPASSRDLREAQEIVREIAPLADECEQLERTLASLRELADCPEREALIERSLALRGTLQALKRERQAFDMDALDSIGLTVAMKKFQHFISSIRLLHGHITLLEDRFCAYDNTETPSSHGHAVAEERLRCLRRVGARCLNLIARLSRRTAVLARAALVAHTPSSPAPHFYSRSLAARSRMLAPAGAPPSAF
jgi:hypothetical protein